MSPIIRARVATTPKWTAIDAHVVDQRHQHGHEDDDVGRGIDETPGHQKQAHDQGQHHKGILADGGDVLGDDGAQLCSLARTQARA